MGFWPIRACSGSYLCYNIHYCYEFGILINFVSHCVQNNFFTIKPQNRGMESSAKEGTGRQRANQSWRKWWTADKKESVESWGWRRWWWWWWWG